MSHLDGILSCDGPRRILTLDGGGIHGVFALQVLREMERQLAASPAYRERTDFRLADHFHLIAGTSTGAIIATMLAWGLSVEEIETFYLEGAPKIFSPATWWRRWVYNRFSSDGIADFLQRTFAETDGSVATLGTARLRTLLLVVLRNASSGSPWPLTNNPRSRYNARPPGESNLEIPLWQIVRASTAAPVFFPAQEITTWSSRRKQRVPAWFIDGGVSPYNNPAYLAYQIATLPEYRVGFPRGADALRIVSVGVGRPDARYAKGEMQDMTVLHHVRAVIAAMMDAASVQQDQLCRTTGVCLHGAPLDSELETLMPPTPDALAAIKPTRQFSYVRYNHTYSPAEMSEALADVGGQWDLANLGLMETAMVTGKSYAAAYVRLEHLTNDLEAG